MDIIKVGGSEWIQDIETYVDEALCVSHQEVPEEPRLVQVTEPDHVVHTLDRGGVHGPDGAFSLLVDLVLLYVCYERRDITQKVYTDFPGPDESKLWLGFVPFRHHRSAEAGQCRSPWPPPR